VSAFRGLWGGGGARGIALADALIGYLHAFAGNLVSAGLRSGSSARPTGSASSPRWSRSSPAPARGADPRAGRFRRRDLRRRLASMAHETQHVRLFRS